MQFYTILCNSIQFYTILFLKKNTLITRTLQSK